MNIQYGSEELILDTGKIANQANGSVMVRYGGTVVLVTACMSKEPREGLDFFPLSVEYQEKTYAAGRIPGGFFKREGRPSESEILTSRLIDRPIRPLFPSGFHNDVQVMAIVLSSDGVNDPDIFSVIGASAALMISDIPFDGPIASCRVGRIDGGFILNPSYDELDKTDLDVVIVANNSGIMMLESRGNEVSEDIYMEAVRFGFDKLKPVLKLQEDFRSKFGKPKKEIEFKNIPAELLKKVEELSRERLKEVYKLGEKEKREEELNILFGEVKEKFDPEEYEEKDIKNALIEVEKNQVRNMILNDKKRVDGRGLSDIRNINCEVKFLPRTHGSGLFTRGQTQSLAVTTLGTGEDEQLVEALEGERHKSFMLHYTFPPFSVGETKPVRGPGRREIGHGALAEKSLLAVMPAKEDFPYTIRVVSEILESNGSSSMATVCAATLSLMDAGVPIKEAVAGIALGLVKEGDKEVILTDIAGVEDHFGDMDFKVAGTKNGVTAVQMDLKINGISLGLLEKALHQSKQARSFILDKIADAISNPRQELSSYAPRINVIKIPQEKIGELIGPGGKTIKKIIATTGASIDIQDDGNVLVGSTDASQAQEAIKMIKAITDDIEVGRIYNGKVKRIAAFGAFCEIAPGKDGLVHVSEFSDRFIKDLDKEIKIGDEFKVKVIGIDEMGKVRLSKKQADKEAEEKS